jgi:simple sugar transport system permease protein
MKATPLCSIALGLAVCFRSNVWNIGAEGQFVVGAIAASGIADARHQGHRQLVLPAGARRRRRRRHGVGGDHGGAARPLQRQRDPGQPDARLRRRAAASTTSSTGPWKDPAGYNFPQTITFYKATQVPRLFGTFRVNLGAIAALLAVGAFWLLLFRTYAGFQLPGRRPRAGGGALRGASPRGGRCGPRCSSRAAWPGLAGGPRGRRPLGQLTPHVPAGYGFAAIIVAFVGRLHPLGIVFSAILMSMFYIGGELAQSRLGLPKSLTGVFQGLLLFTLLACDTLIAYRVRWKTGGEGSRA